MGQQTRFAFQFLLIDRGAAFLLSDPYGLAIDATLFGTLDHSACCVNWLSKRCQGVQIVHIVGLRDVNSRLETKALLKLLSSFRSQFSDLAITQTSTHLLLPSPFSAMWSSHTTKLDISGGLWNFSLIASLANLKCLRFTPDKPFNADGYDFDCVTKLSRLTKLVVTYTHTILQTSGPTQSNCFGLGAR